jgi:hypothetical protein
MEATYLSGAPGDARASSPFLGDHRALNEPEMETNTSTKTTPRVTSDIVRRVRACTAEGPQGDLQEFTHAPLPPFTGAGQHPSSREWMISASPTIFGS